MWGKIPRDLAWPTVPFQGGHIVAVSLGGFASGPNLLPQDHSFNISAYARLEHGWRRAFRDRAVVFADIALTLDRMSSTVVGGGAVADEQVGGGFGEAAPCCVHATHPAW